MRGNRGYFVNSGNCTLCEMFNFIYVSVQRDAILAGYSNILRFVLDRNEGIDKQG